jgi:hypothetical protein
MLVVVGSANVAKPAYIRDYQQWLKFGSHLLWLAYIIESFGSNGTELGFKLQAQTQFGSLRWRGVASITFVDNNVTASCLPRFFECYQSPFHLPRNLVAPIFRFCSPYPSTIPRLPGSKLAYVEYPPI